MGNIDNNNTNQNHDNQNKIQDAYCVCTQSHGLFVPNRHLSHIVAGGLLGLFFVFLAGFFCGKQHEIKHFLYSIDEDSFADQISSSLYGLSSFDVDNPDADGQEADQDAEQESDQDSDSDSSGESADSDGDSENGVVGRALQSSGAQDVAGNEQAKIDNPVLPVLQPPAPSPALENKKYYAQLIGFGTSAAADSFARRLTKQGFSVKVEKCTSRTAKGRMVTWYKVITPPYDDQKKLQAMVNTVSSKEKLKGVRILTC